MITRKKFVVFILCVVLCISLFSSNVLALNSVNSDENILHIQITNRIEMEIERRNLNDEQIQTIINHFFGVREQQVTSRNIICSAFGHDYDTTITTITRHNVYSSYPKCVKDTYEVSVCSRCDHSETVLLNSIRVGCCQ